MPGKKAQDTKRKHGTYYGEVEDDTPVATMDISDDEVNRRMKSTTTKTITKKNGDGDNEEGYGQRDEENIRNNGEDVL